MDFGLLYLLSRRRKRREKANIDSFFWVKQAVDDFKKSFTKLNYGVTYEVNFLGKPVNLDPSGIYHVVRKYLDPLYIPFFGNIIPNQAYINSLTARALMFPTLYPKYAAYVNKFMLKIK